MADTDNSWKIKTEDDLAKRKSLVIFGRDVSQIPCFRNSFICGICCGLVGGLATFLFTSKVTLSTHVSFGTFWISVIGYWFPCRYKYESTQLAINDILKKKTLWENEK